MAERAEGDGADERGAGARGADDGAGGSGRRGLKSRQGGRGRGRGAAPGPRVPSRRGSAPTLGVDDAYVRRLTPRLPGASCGTCAPLPVPEFQKLPLLRALPRPPCRLNRALTKVSGDRGDFSLVGCLGSCHTPKQAGLGIPSPGALLLLSLNITVSKKASL